MADSDQPPLHILCIAPAFAPIANPEAFCGAKMVQAMLDCGASVTVLSSSNFRQRDTDGSRMWDSVREIVVDVPRPVHPDPLRTIVAAARYQTPFHARWVSATVETAGRLHSARKVDLVYSRSLPKAAHIAGYWCAKTLKVPWVANINDPWDSDFFPVAGSPNGSASWSRANIFWLRRTLRRADLVTYPCKRLWDFHARLAKLNHGAEVIPHIGYRPRFPNHEQNGNFRLLHAGRLLSTHGRFSSSLLLGLKALVDSSAEAAAQIKLALAGPVDAETRKLIGELGLQRNIEIVGTVNYEDSLDLIASASVCVLVEACVDEGIFLPSKLTDYVACGKPVLAISPKVGTAADLASRGELLRIDHDPTAVRDAISALYSEFKRGTLNSRNPSDRLIAEYQGPVIADNFLSACRALTLRAQTARGHRDRKDSWTPNRHSKEWSSF